MVHGKGEEEGDDQRRRSVDSGVVCKGCVAIIESKDKCIRFIPSAIHIHYFSYFENASEAFVPPKPKLFESATFIRLS